jgi:hypothetical protein
MKNLSILLGALVIFVSCGPNVHSTSDLSSFLTDNRFFCEEPYLDDSETYSFDGSSFKVEYKNKRSGEIKIYDGTYEVKSGKFSDNGDEFLYVKLIFNDLNFATFQFGKDGNKFLVYDDGNLCEPNSTGSCSNCEDEYGLKLTSSQVVAAINSSYYKPIDK